LKVIKLPNARTLDRSDWSAPAEVYFLIDATDTVYMHSLTMINHLDRKARMARASLSF
jgi:hypothetical protein